MLGIIEKINDMLFGLLTKNMSEENKRRLFNDIKESLTPNAKPRKPKLRVINGRKNEEVKDCE